jgi:hypothetical protein
MRTIGIRLLLLSFALFAFGCGSSNSANISGNWLATTTSQAGGQALTINFTMQEGTANGNTTPVTFSNFTFSPTNNCFDNTNANATGTITAAVQAGANRTMSIDLWSAPAATGNHAVLTMTIDPSNNSATGTYNITGIVGGCNPDNGSVTFTRQ